MRVDVIITHDREGYYLATFPGAEPAIEPLYRRDLDRCVRAALHAVADLPGVTEVHVSRPLPFEADFGRSSA